MILELNSNEYLVQGESWYAAYKLQFLRYSFKNIGQIKYFWSLWSVCPVAKVLWSEGIAFRGDGRNGRERFLPYSNKRPTSN